MPGFWFRINALLQKLFEENQTLENVRDARKDFQTLIAEAKKIMPSLVKKKPQNIHSLLELLFIDLEIWVNIYLISGTKEEQKHQIYKLGSKSTNPINTEKQLIQRDACVSFLRYLLHHGGIGPNNTSTLSSSFLKFSHPKNELAPHPLYTMTTSYVKEEFQDYPRFYYYNAKGQRLMKELSEEDSNAIQMLLELPQGNSVKYVTPSKQFVKGNRSFALGDNVAVTGANEERWFLEIAEINTVTTIGKTVFRGYWYEKVKMDPKTQKQIYKKATLSSWQTFKVVLELVQVYHHCDSNCVIEELCSVHQACESSCSSKRVHLQHSQTNEFLITEKLKNLSS